MVQLGGDDGVGRLREVADRLGKVAADVDVVLDCPWSGPAIGSVAGADIASGTFTVDARPVPMEDVEQAWTATNALGSRAVADVSKATAAPAGGRCRSVAERLVPGSRVGARGRR